MKVRDAMHSPAEWVSPDTPVRNIAKRMAMDDIGCVPVAEDHRLIGMITDRDLAVRVVAQARDALRTTAADVLSPDVVYSRTEETVEDAVHVMDQHQIRRLPVLDEKDRLVGMLSLGDVAAVCGRDLAGELLRAVAKHHG